MATWRHGLVRRAAAAALLAALALILAACGGGRDANDYRADVRDVQEQYFADLERYASDATDEIGVDDAAAARALQQYAAVATKLAADLEAIEPPADALDVGERLVGAYRGLATSASGLRTALASGDVTQVDEAATGFNRGQEQLAAAVKDLNDAD